MNIIVVVYEFIMIKDSREWWVYIGATRHLWTKKECSPLIRSGW
jgi:hypothetical protein